MGVGATDGGGTYCLGCDAADFLTFGASAFGLDFEGVTVPISGRRKGERQQNPHVAKIARNDPDGPLKSLLYLVLRRRLIHRIHSNALNKFSPGNRPMTTSDQIETTLPETQAIAYDANPLDTINEVSVTEETINVLMPNGKLWGFVALKNSKERRKLLADTEAFVEKVQAADGVGATMRAHWKKNGVTIPEDAEDLRTTFQIHSRSRNPKLTIETAFRLVNAPETLAYIYASLEIGDKAVMTLFMKQKKEELLGNLLQTPITGEGLSSGPESSPDSPNPI